MAAELGCHVRTIYRELERNATDGQHYPARAEALADGRLRARKQPWKLEDPALGQYVQEKLSQYWSPEQISGRLEIDYPGRPDMRMSPQAIYEWIARDKRAGGSWHTYLRQSHRQRRKRYASRENRGRIVDRVGIDSHYRHPTLQEASAGAVAGRGDGPVGSPSHHGPHHTCRAIHCFPCPNRVCRAAGYHARTGSLLGHRAT